MMSRLTDYLKDKAERLRAEEPSRKQLVQEWRASLDRLLTRLEGWMREADTEGVLVVSRSEHRFNDEKMGAYTAPGLAIELDGERVEIVPVARLVGGSVHPPDQSNPVAVSGRVDLVRYGDAMYTLYRTGTGDAETWFVVYAGAWDARQKRRITKSLTREEFEQDLMSMFE